MKETSSSRAHLGCRLVFDASSLSEFPLLCYLIVPNQNNCNNCLSEEIKLKALKSSMETALDGRSHQGVQKGYCCCPQLQAGSCEAGWEILPAQGSVAERLDAAFPGSLTQRAVVQLVTGRSVDPSRKGSGSDIRLKMVLCGGDISHPCKPPALPVLSREHIAALRVHKHMDACAYFPRRESPLCLDG